MDEEIIFSAMNAPVAEMSKVKESTNRSAVKRNVDVLAPEKSVGRKSMRKKTGNIKVKKSQNVTEQEASYDANQSATDENIEKNRKRKAEPVEVSENNTEQEIEDNAGDNDTNATDVEGNKNDTEKYPKVKSARKEKSENIAQQKIIDNSKTVNENSENVAENKKDNNKISTGKSAVHPPVSEMVLDSFKTLRKRNGTSVEEISKCIEEKFQVNINRLKPHIKKFLLKGVADGLFDQVNGTGRDGKFKIKKTGKVSSQTGKSRGSKCNKRSKDVKKHATGIKKGSGQVMRKVKVDKVKPKKRMNA